MTTVIKGKNITNFYSVKANKTTKVINDNEPKTIYTARPELIKGAKVEWLEICSFEGDMSYDEVSSYYFGLGSRTIHISEEEKVNVDKVIFRADLNEKHVFTNKVINEVDDYESKFSSEMIFNDELSGFNAAMINSNDTMLAYCKLHHLPPEGTDCIELFKLVYPDETYEIVDGVMKKKETSKYEFSEWATVKSDLATTSTSFTNKICALESSVATITCSNGNTIAIKA